MGGGRGRGSWREEGGENREGCEGEGWACCKRLLEGEGICGLVDEAGASDESKDHGGILWERCNGPGNMLSMLHFDIII